MFKTKNITYLPNMTVFKGTLVNEVLFHCMAKYFIAAHGAVSSFDFVTMYNHYYHGSF